MIYKYGCEYCNKTHIDRNDIFECYICGKEICYECAKHIEPRDDGNEDWLICEKCESGEMQAKYPEDFWDNSDGVDIKENEIIRYLNDAKEQLKNSPFECDFHFTATGNTMVMGMKFEDEYKFCVFKNYKSIDVDKEDINKVKF